jgi:hypothetical protein
VLERLLGREREIDGGIVLERDHDGAALRRGRVARPLAHEVVGARSQERAEPGALAIEAGKRLALEVAQEQLLRDLRGHVGGEPPAMAQVRLDRHPVLLREPLACARLRVLVLAAQVVEHRVRRERKHSARTVAPS